MKKNITILALIVLLLAHIQSLAQCSCSLEIAGSNSDLNISSGQTICIVSGTQTGNINFNGNATLCVGSKATLSSNNLNNFNSGATINIYGVASFANSVNFGGGNINNYNNLTFGNNPNFNGASTITNFNGAVISLGQSTTLSKGRIYNYGFIDAKADFSTNTSTTFFNVNRIHISGNFNPSGTVSNSGIIVAKAFINFNSGEPFINNCRLVAVKGFNNNNNSRFENHGIVWVPGNENSDNLIQLNSNLINTGYIRTPRIINNATLTNTGGAIRIEGSSNSSDAASRNNGNGKIIGGNVGDASNVSKTPPYSFDDNTGTISAAYTLVPAYDTNSTQYATNCSPNYFGYSISGTLYNDPNGLTDNYIGEPAEGAALPSAPIYANLVNKTSGLVVSSLQIDVATGNFTFYGVAPADYIINISTILATVGQTNTQIKMPSGWIGVGEFLGAGEGSDDLPDNKLAVTISNANVSNAKFGIQELPVAEERTVFLNKAVPDEKYTLNEPSTSILPLEGTDPHDGVLGVDASFIITSLPANARLFYDGQEILNPVEIDENFDLVVPSFGTFSVNPSIIPNYNPSLLKISFTDEFPGSTKFAYSVMDAAGKYSAPADYNISAVVILPITVSNLKGTLNTNSSESLLSWQIIGAEGLLNCTVERSLDGQQFAAITTINATGNGSLKYTDNFSTVLNTQSGRLIYYRLKITTADGLIYYSNIIRLHLNKSGEVLITPNPTRNQILISGIEEKTIVSLLDTQGKTLQQQASAGNNVRMNLAAYPTGIYYVKIIGENNSVIAIKKIVKE